MAKRLVIDLDRCDECRECGVRCGHGGHYGALAIRERATFAVICRRCEEASCVDACPYLALERQADGVLLRHNLRCVSCKLCAHACPFGTIYPDMLSFYVTPCDACLGDGDGPPSCAGTCARGALTYREVSEDEPSVHIVDDYLAARSARWVKREAGCS
jgi:Fe-S-cluster-containing hydrogenase component 2